MPPMLDTPLANLTPSADECLQLGLRASAAGDAQSAMSWFQTAAQLAPGSGVPPFLLAAEMAEAGQMAEAEQAFAQAVVLAPTLWMARFQLGLIQYTSGRIPMALVSWGPLFELPPTEFLQPAVRGFAAAAMEQWHEALNYLEQAQQLNPDNPAFNRDLQKVMARIQALHLAPPAPEAPLTTSAEAPPLAPPAAQPTPACSPTTPPTDEPQPEEDKGLHVLLASYQTPGLLH